MSRYRSSPSHRARHRRPAQVPPWSRRATTGRHRAAGRARRGGGPWAAHRAPRRQRQRRLMPAALGMTLAAAVVSSWFAVGGAVAMAAMLR